MCKIRRIETARRGWAENRGSGVLQPRCYYNLRAERGNPAQAPRFSLQQPPIALGARHSIGFKASFAAIYLELIQTYGLVFISICSTAEVV